MDVLPSQAVEETDQPMDWQDKMVMAACAICFVFVIVLVVVR